MKSRRLLQFRMLVALVLGIVFIAAGFTSHQNFYAAQPLAHIWPALKAWFGLLWIVQAYFLARQLKPQNIN